MKNYTNFIICSIFLHGMNVFTQNLVDDTDKLVNVFCINSVDNTFASKSVENSLNYIRAAYPNYLGQIYKIEINSLEPRDSVRKICSEWNRSMENAPHVIIDTTLTGKNAELVQMISSKFGIPIVSTRFRGKNEMNTSVDDENPNIIPIISPANLLPEVIKEVVLNLEIRDVAILIDHDFPFDPMYGNMFLDVPIRKIVMKIEPVIQDLKDQIDKLWQLKMSNVFVIGNQDTFNLILKTARGLHNQTRQKHAWFAVTLDECQLQCYNCINFSIVSVSPNVMEQSQQSLYKNLINKGVLSKPYMVTAFYFEVTKLVVLTMNKALKSNLWDTTVNRINCDSYYNEKQEHSIQTFDFLGLLHNVIRTEKVNSLFDDYVWVEAEGLYPEFHMNINFLTFNNSTTISKEMIGSWTARINEPLKNLNKQLVMNHSMHNYYRIVVRDDPPFVQYDEGTKEFFGYCIDILKELQKELKFGYDLYQVNGPGEIDTDGNWSGMIGELQRQNAEIGLCGLVTLPEFEKIVDFTIPYFEDIGMSILMLDPKVTAKIHNRLFKFSSVMERGVWLSILIIYFCIAIVMWIIDRWSPFSYQNNQNNYRDSSGQRVFTLTECFWFCVISLTPQGGGEAPKSLSGKFITITWWFFIFIIISSYSANLAAIITIRQTKTGIQSLDDLRKQFVYKYSVTINTSTYHHFEKMVYIESKFHEAWGNLLLDNKMNKYEKSKYLLWNYPIDREFTDLFNGFKRWGFFESHKSALESVLNYSDRFAVIDNAARNKYYASLNCNLKVIGKEFTRRPFSIAVRNGSPLRDRINDVLLKLTNDKVLEKLKHKWWKQNHSCGTERGINIEDIGGVFIIFSVLLGIFTILFVTEIFYNRTQSQNQHNRSIKTKPQVNEQIRDVSTRRVKKMHRTKKY